MFACKSCAGKLNDEIKCARKVCAAVDEKKTQAEYIINNRNEYVKFLSDIEITLKKIPDDGNLISNISSLILLVKSYVTGDYGDIPNNAIVAVVATLLYVISPIDIISDIIPGVGFTDDAMAVSLCIKMIQDDLEKFKAWKDKKNEMSYY